MSISVGAVGTASTVVTPENTAAAVGSGALPVFATPYMIALMENAASTCLVPYLAEDEGSVGTHLDVAHSSATPIGMKVWAEAEITAVGHIQAGVVGGYVGAMEYLIRQAKQELGCPDVKVVATGGLARLITKHTDLIDIVDGELILDGLRMIWEDSRK